MKCKAVILANENSLDHLFWVNSCKNYKEKISYSIVYITSSEFINEVLNENPDIILTKPGGTVDYYKQLYDEKLYILCKILKYKAFPSFEEVLIYENKRFLSYWLEANNLPHPKTRVFYSKNDALKFVNVMAFPIVAKLNIGASGNGVKILKNKIETKHYINNIFKKGIYPSIGPKLNKKHLLRRLIKKLLKPEEIKERFSTYTLQIKNPQKNFCLFQEYIPHKFEWRVVRIGNSFYAHKKMVKNEKASGSLIKEYLNPPLDLLTFVKDITDLHKFYSMAIDIFEDEKGIYLINEMQCIFGQSDPYQMLINDVPGRYVWDRGQWAFEKGMFNSNECFDERLDFVISELEKSK